jgi:hypothetical protein
MMLKERLENATARRQPLLAAHMARQNKFLSPKNKIVQIGFGT